MKFQSEILALEAHIFQTSYKSMTEAISMFSMSTFIKRGLNIIQRVEKTFKTFLTIFAPKACNST